MDHSGPSHCCPRELSHGIFLVGSGGRKGCREPSCGWFGIQHLGFMKICFFFEWLSRRENSNKRAGGVHWRLAWMGETRGG